MKARTLWGLMLLASLSACDSATRYEYESLAEAKQDKSIKAAAIPPFVPGSAREIVGSYHVETNEGSIEFSFDKAELEKLTSGFQRADKAQADRIVEEIARQSWRRPPGEGALDFYVRTGPEYARETLVVDRSVNRAFWLGTGHIDQRS